MPSTKAEAAVEAVEKAAATLERPDGVKAENVLRRTKGLIAHGTPPNDARAIAEDAEAIQVHQDNQSAKERDEAEKAAANAVPDRLRTLTLEKLLAYASEESIAIPEGTTLKKDVLAFLLAAYEQSRKAAK